MFEIFGSWDGHTFDDPGEAVDQMASEFQHHADELPDLMKRELKLYLSGVAERLAVRHGVPWPGGTTATTLSRRSGALVDSILGSVKVDGDLGDIIGHIGGIYYAKTHETGAVLTSRHGGYLCIPLPAALNADGTPKMLRPRDWGNTYKMKSKAGNLIIFKRTARKGAGIPLYVLKKSVTIPARLGMGIELEGGITEFSNSMLAAVRSEFGI